MTRLIVLRGLPGSGKSTWARDHVRQERAWYVNKRRARVGIVSRDTIREHVLGLTMQGGDAVLDRDGEDLVTAVCEAIAGVLLAAGRDVVADATNLATSHVDAWRTVAAAHGATVQIVDMDVPVEGCIRRDAARAAAGGRSVGADIIRQMAERGVPTYEETRP